MRWHTFEEIEMGEVVDRGKVGKEVRMAAVEASELQLHVAALGKSTVVGQWEGQRMRGGDRTIVGGGGGGEWTSRGGGERVACDLLGGLILGPSRSLLGW